MKSFKEYLNLGESLIFSGKYEIAKKDAIDKKLSGEEGIRHVNSVMNDPKTFQAVAEKFKGFFSKGSLFKADADRKEIIIKIGSNSSVTIVEPNNYDANIRCTFFLKKCTPEDLKRFADAVNKLNTF